MVVIEETQNPQLEAQLSPVEPEAPRELENNGDWLDKSWGKVRSDLEPRSTASDI